MFYDLREMVKTKVIFELKTKILLKLKSMQRQLTEL